MASYKHALDPRVEAALGWVISWLSISFGPPQTKIPGEDSSDLVLCGFYLSLFSILNIYSFLGWGSCSSRPLSHSLEALLCTPVLVYSSQFKHVGSTSATGAYLLWYFPSALHLFFPVSHFPQAQWLLCSCDSSALNHACLGCKSQGNVSGTPCWLGAPACGLHTAQCSEQG